MDVKPGMKVKVEFEMEVHRIELEKETQSLIGWVGNRLFTAPLSSVKELQA